MFCFFGQIYILFIDFCLFYVYNKHIVLQKLREAFTYEKVLKVIGIIAAVAGAIFGVYVIVKKYVDSKKVVIGNDAENYVSCSCCDDNFVSETVA